MITFKEYFMLQEAPVGAAQKARAARSSKELQNPGEQGRAVGAPGGQQPNAAIPGQPVLPRIQNHAAIKGGAQDPQIPGATKSPVPPPAAAGAGTKSPGSFGTPFDTEIERLDLTNPEAIQELLGRMNQAVVTNQSALDSENDAAAQGLVAPNQDRLGVAGANLGRQRNYLQGQQVSG
jgi:hypothetical protein